MSSLSLGNEWSWPGIELKEKHWENIYTWKKTKQEQENENLGDIREEAKTKTTKRKNLI